MSIAERVASRHLAKTFLMKDPHKELKGETIEVSKIPEYQRDVDRLAKEYKEAKSELDKIKQQKGGKAKGMAGYKLSQIGNEGRKARARLELAKKMKEKGLTKTKF